MLFNWENYFKEIWKKNIQIIMETKYNSDNIKLHFVSENRLPSLKIFIKKKRCYIEKTPPTSLKWQRLRHVFWRIHGRVPVGKSILNLRKHERRSLANIWTSFKAHLALNTIFS